MKCPTCRSENTYLHAGKVVLECIDCGRAFNRNDSLDADHEEMKHGSKEVQAT